MVYFFVRDNQFVRCETREVANARWEVTVVQSDGHEIVETYGSASALDDRLRELESELRNDGWSGPHGRRS